MRSIAFLAALTLVACATTAKYEAMLDTWKGADVNRLVVGWGPPASTFTMPNGTQVYEYMWNGGTNAVTTYNPAFNQAYTNVNSYWCKTSFFVQGGSVTSWRHEGNSCRSKQTVQKKQQKAAEHVSIMIDHSDEIDTGKCVLNGDCPSGQVCTDAYVCGAPDAAPTSTSVTWQHGIGDRCRKSADCGDHLVCGGAGTCIEGGSH